MSFFFWNKTNYSLLYEVDPKTKCLKRKWRFETQKGFLHFTVIHGFGLLLRRKRERDKERETTHLLLPLHIHLHILDLHSLILRPIAFWSISAFSYGFPYQTQIHGLLQVRPILSSLSHFHIPLLSLFHAHTYFFFWIWLFGIFQLWVRLRILWLFRKFDSFFFFLNNSERIWLSRCPLVV